MRLKINERTGVTLWALGFAVTPHILRDHYLPQLFASINLLSALGILIICKKSLSKQASKVCSLFLVLFAFVIYFLNESNILSTVKYTISVFWPVLILSFKCFEGARFAKYFSVFLKYLNWSVGFIACCGIVDILTDWSASRFFASFYDVASLRGMVNQGRLVSYMGHSLVTAEITLIYFIFHIVNEFYITKKRRIIFPTAISVFVIALTGSKTGMVLLGALLLIAYGNIKMLKYVPLVLLALFVGYELGIFDVLISRLMQGIKAGDISTGRFTAFEKLYSSGALQFNWFLGHDGALINQNTAMIAALENPILRWAVRFGIIFALLMTIRVFVLPLLDMIRVLDMRLFLIVLIYIIDVNTYDSICSIGDGMLRCCTVLFMLLCAMKYAKVKT